MVGLTASSSSRCGINSNERLFSPLPSTLQTLPLGQLGSRTAKAYITLSYWHSHKARSSRQWLAWHGFKGKTEVKSVNLHLPPVVIMLHSSFYLLKRSPRPLWLVQRIDNNLLILARQAGQIESQRLLPFNGHAHDVATVLHYTAPLETRKIHKTLHISSQIMGLASFITCGYAATRQLLQQEYISSTKMYHYSIIDIPEIRKTHIRGLPSQLCQ